MAKLNADKLAGACKKTLAPVYVITGDEPLLVQEACDTVRAAAKKQGFSERELYHTDSGFTWDTLIHSANSMSLFAQRKIIEIRVHNGKPGDAGAKIIREYCQNPSSDNLLLLILPKIDKRSQNSAWFKALDSSGVVVTVWPINAQTLPHWIQSRLQHAGLSVDPQGLDILCAKIEGNLLAAVQEIEKLKLIAKDGVIDAKTMGAAVMSSARYDVFSLADKALSGDYKSALTCLHGLRSEGTEPPIVLWALAREIRTITTIKESLESGKNFDMAAKSCGVWDSRKGLVRQALQRLNLRQLHSLVRKASHADKSIKGMADGEVWDILLDIILSMSGIQALTARTQRLIIQTS
ncbi:MAG: DNA polymerase III subunit delta [Alteromonadaceae bacterium]|nr:MAG: DNA polymerase III subunit delta [Alteromonadaceae bacterium]